ncbi:MAG: SDR family NAD(P)-dependent oxidoreductase, partial [Armatimonadetes bacterium]|nr:SDR family NAD(P)-dependent oxidoreductase [Armatimonadota bacterium]
MDLNELFGLYGKTAVITGSARGLGKEIALALARCGASLILADVEYPEETARQAEDAGGHCVAVQTDISDESQVKKLAEIADSEYGKVDVLVNNAGVSQLSYTPTEDLSVEEWNRIVGIHLTGTFLCSKYIGKLMINSGGGSI